MTLTDLLGNDDADWMSDPGRKCALPNPENYAPQEVGQFADLWFPSEHRDIGYAKRLCRGCPVRTECLQYALDDPHLEGIFGGTSTGGRVELRKKRRANAA